MGYQETTGMTSQEINLDFALVRLNQGDPDLGEVWESMEPYRSVRNVQEQ